MTYRLRNILVAVTLALVAALLTSYYISNYQRNVRQDENNVSVFVATHDIPAGTSGADLLHKGVLTKTEIVRRSVVPGAISDPNQLGDLVAAQPILAGEQVTTRRFSTPESRGISSQLKGIQRAIAVPGDSNQLLVGTLKDRDRVDVVASWLFPEGSQTHVTRVILRNILVLRAPQGGPAAEKITSSAATFSATLAVNDTQVQKLYWAMKNGEWHLELRPAIEAADSPENVVSARSLLLDGVRPGQIDAAAVGGN